MSTFAGIRSIVVTRVYADLGRFPAARMGKFVVLFDRPLAPEEIASIAIRGPGGYSFRLAAGTAFDARNLNGFLVEKESRHLWYMAFDREGFLSAGEYTVTVEFADGRISARSRTLRPADALLSAYLQNVAAIERHAAAGVSGNVEIRWSPLSALGGPDACYCLRISEGRSWPTADLGRLVFFDNIFEAPGDAGLNLGTAAVRLPRGRREYTWFVEILNSNRYEEIDLAIFQPAGWFTAGDEER